MRTEARRRVVIALVGVAALIVGGLYYAQRMLSTRVRTVEGTLVQLDPAAHRAAIEIRHPKTGQLISIRGDVPAECDIRIDGRAATLADLRLGERVRVQGTITVDGRVTADWVRVTRAAQPAGPTSQPASPAEPP
jgi:hypothetical protein